MLDDKYRIERLLAVGGMGAVYDGTHIKLRKRVAIKVLNPQLSSPAFIERFHREAITASQIGHEGIAQVTDIGTSTEGEPFLVMEYLDGESLATRLKAQGQLPVEVACELGCSILAPLEAAHRAGIVHRDLKPDNVFLVRQSRGEMIKLLDFGISRSQGQEGEFRLTTTGLVLGTPYYMSPEQARGDAQIGIAADLYAFGVIMYEMLTGAVPISGDNYNQLMYKVMTGEYVRPREKRPEIPEALQAIILQTMALEAAQRPQSAVHLEHMLLPFCRPTFREHTIERISAQGMSFKQSSPSIGAGNATTGTDRTILASPSAVGTSAPAATSVRPKSKGLYIALGLVVVAGIGIAAVVVAGAGGEAKPEPVAVAPPPKSEPPKTEPVNNGSPAKVEDPPNIVDPPPVVVKPETVTLQFAIKPAAIAKITIDGTPVDGTEVSLPKDAAQHQLVISAKGYATRTEKLVLDMSQRLSFELDKKPPDRPVGKAGGNRPTGKDPKTNRIDTQSPYK